MARLACKYDKCRPSRAKVLWQPTLPSPRLTHLICSGDVIGCVDGQDVFTFHARRRASAGGTKAERYRRARVRFGFLLVHLFGSGVGSTCGELALVRLEGDVSMGRGTDLNTGCLKLKFYYLRLRLREEE